MMCLSLPHWTSLVGTPLGGSLDKRGLGNSNLLPGSRLDSLDGLACPMDCGPVGRSLN